MKCKMNLEERRKLLDGFGDKVFNITWVKKDGTIRTCVARKKQHDMFAEGHASKAHTSTVAHKQNLYTCVDKTNGKWVNVSLDKLVAVKCGVLYEFDEEN